MTTSFPLVLKIKVEPNLLINEEINTKIKVEPDATVMESGFGITKPNIVIKEEIFLPDIKKETDVENESEDFSSYEGCTSGIDHDNFKVKKRCLWSADQMSRAIDAVKSKQMTVRDAAKNYQVPRGTLHSYVSSGNTYRKIGRPTVLTIHEENDLCNRLCRLADEGFPLTNKIFKQCVFAYCENKKIKNPFNDEKKQAGRKWLQLFLKRHPDVAKQKMEVLNSKKTVELNKLFADRYEELQQK